MDSMVNDTASGWAGVFDDFAFYLGTVSPELERRGIRVQQASGEIARYSVAGRRDSVALNPDSGVAYLFVSPSGRHIMRGVLTNVDILRVADSVFRRSP